MLFQPERHETLCGPEWSEPQARAAIRGIVAELEQALGDGISWPGHPLDPLEAGSPAQKGVYLGSAGMLNALASLEAQGVATLRVKPAALIGRVYESYLAEPDTATVVPSYFLGEAGILLVLWRLTKSQAAADRLETVIRSNIPNPVNEALWGAPGTVVGALHMHAWTAEARWGALFLENADQIWSLWLPSEHVGCRLWTQDLYGDIIQLLGAGHGFAGNVYPLIRGASLLNFDRRAMLYDRCVETLRTTAIVEGDAANWPASVGLPPPGGSPIVMQWCHGAPGMVTGLAGIPPHWSSELDELLLMGGTAVWKAGPLSKGFGLCHGTAGNGYAFLKLYQRTGEALWLDRARAFAMHALAQQQRMSAEYGRGRYSLWTGDPGLAMYLWHCINGTSDMPALDTFV